jgi:hypothetical protein
LAGGVTLPKRPSPFVSPAVVPVALAATLSLYRKRMLSLTVQCTVNQFRHASAHRAASVQVMQAMLSQERIRWQKK